MEGSTEVRGWRPTEGESISGRVVDLDQGWSDQSSSFYPIVTIQTESGERVNVHCFHTALRNRLEGIKPGIGDRLKIRYRGKQPHKKDPNRTVAQYDVEAPDRKVDAESFWGSSRGEKPATATEDQLPLNEDDDIPF